MFKSAAYVLKENFKNLFRIYSISKYEVLADMRDSKLGLFWNFANPLIQVLTYWFVFGYVMKRGDSAGIPYIIWMLGGIVVWFYISPCITDGCNAIFRKVDIITKMKFPVSILPTTVALSKLFDHLCMMVVLVVVFAFCGYYPSVHWLGLFYYLLCAVIFSVSLSMTTSVLNMIARDTRKLILAFMRLLLYLTPVLWNADVIDNPVVRKIVSLNPISYIVGGYRDCFFYHEGIMYDPWSMASFWIITAALFFFGSSMMNKFRTRFIDMI